MVTARVHPGETPASWMMKGFMDFLTGDSLQAKVSEDRIMYMYFFVHQKNPHDASITLSCSIKWNVVGTK